MLVCSRKIGEEVLTSTDFVPIIDSLLVNENATIINENSENIEQDLDENEFEGKYQNQEKDYNQEDIEEHNITKDNQEEESEITSNDAWNLDVTENKIDDFPPEEDSVPSNEVSNQVTTQSPVSSNMMQDQNSDDYIFTMTADEKPDEQYMDILEEFDYDDMPEEGLNIPSMLSALFGRKKNIMKKWKIVFFKLFSIFAESSQQTDEEVGGNKDEVHEQVRKTTGNATINVSSIIEFKVVNKPSVTKAFDKRSSIRNILSPLMMMLLPTRR